MGFEDGKAWQRTVDNAVSWVPTKYIHIAALERAQEKLGLLRTPHFIEDEDGLHDGAIANIFTPREEKYEIKLDNGEELEFAPEDSVQVFERIGPAQASELRVGDYVEYSGRKYLVNRIVADTTGELLARADLKDLGPVNFLRGDAAAENLTIYRAVTV